MLPLHFTLGQSQESEEFSLQDFFVSTQTVTSVEAQAAPCEIQKVLDQGQTKMK